MWKKITLTKAEVETLRLALNLHLDLLTQDDNFDADEWPSDFLNLDKLLGHTFKDIAEGAYCLDIIDVELINRALRHHVRQLYIDLQKAFEFKAPQSLIYNLYDTQQDVFMLVSKFPYYTSDRPQPL